MPGLQPFRVSTGRQQHPDPEQPEQPPSRDTRMMDYSAISQQDPGTSTWASPGPDRTTFAESESNANDIDPTSPLPPQQSSPYDVATAQPWASSKDEGPDAPDLSDRLLNAQSDHPENAVEQTPYAPQQQQPPPTQQPQYAPQQQQQQSQVPARYQTPARQNDKHPAPLYKIQARITGLERTGKKDPILRFDVHVSSPCWAKYRPDCLA